MGGGKEMGRENILTGQSPFPGAAADPQTQENGLKELAISAAVY